MARSSKAQAESEWNFDNVPEPELGTCRLWEYARESDFIRSVWKRSVEASESHLSWQERLEFVGRDFSKIFGSIGRAAILFQKGFYRLGGCLPASGDNSPFPAAWSEVSKNLRALLVETAELEDHDDIPIPGFRRASQGEVEALAKAFRPKSMKEAFGSSGAIGVVEFFNSGSKLREISPNFISPDGTETLAVEIDWGEFTNKQLAAHFARWLKQNRPAGIRKPGRRGRKKKDVRVALDRLGMMRILHRWSLPQIPRESPEAWKAFEGYEWYKERTRAGAMFRKLFPFLPPSERPRSWATKGGRSK